MKKKCLECSSIVHGRADKKFCGDFCRNTYNNRLNRESNKIIRNINKRLKKNYTILKNTYKRRVVSKAVLIELGFDFNYITTYEDHKGHISYYLYDRGFRVASKDTYVILKRKQ